MITAVKICGITRVQDALASARLGAHAVGFVFYAASPRHVAPEAAAAMVRALPPFITTVGLFVDADARSVRRVLDAVPLGLLQFHGDETPQFCGGFGVPYIKAVRVRPDIDLIEYARRYDGARGLLLDAYVDNVHGGSGTTFDWDLIPRQLPLPIILSGGLTTDNVADAVRRVRPAAVDVSSGVESAPGVKDERKIAAFIRSVRNADV
ncbi:MAG TPA: phosphoribosylanthranilate isomerase [Burkholderiales bacterium]|nr:phosphoribosylanthranilate isomerase [Burkholderiales bacterium]